jgi:hypothetical protein
LKSFLKIEGSAVVLLEMKSLTKIKQNSTSNPQSQSDIKPNKPSDPFLNNYQNIYSFDKGNNNKNN